MTEPGEPNARVFCDANAGVPALAAVLHEFRAAEQRFPGNPASAHTAGRHARGALENARQRIASAFGLAATDVLFTSGGTEACNLAVRGLGDASLPVVCSPAEHPAVAQPARERGVVEWSVDNTGSATVTAPATPVGLVCLVHAQSEVGTLQPVDAAIALADDLGVPLLVDASQSLGRIDLRSLADTGAVVALSPHKAGGLRGHGVLLGRDLASRLRPLQLGGSQELGLRAGTQSPALAVANALAIDIALREQCNRAKKMTALRDAFLAALRAQTNRIEVLTPLSNSLANTVMLCFEMNDGRNLLPTLDLAGVEASHGSACSSGSPTPPRILTAMGIDEPRARACVRFSFDWRMDLDASRNVGTRVGQLASRLAKKN